MLKKILNIKIIKVSLLIIGFLLLLCGVAVLLWLRGILQFNNPSSDEFPVAGVDVSAYQGVIDWETLASEDIRFAFIKATEGSSFVDANFEYNYSEATNTDLRVGAYHFFSYDSPGSTQAENFITNVPITENMLPPVIDIEFYGDKKQNLPKKEATQQEMDVLVEMLTEHYDMAPIIYATELSYELYIADSYPECDIWIRGIFYEPTLPDGREWVFWQYSDKGRLSGYDGVEEFIDLNVFLGSVNDFENYYVNK